MTSWTAEVAKARFSEVMRRARTEGPQEITLRGKPAVVVVSAEQANAETGPETMADLLTRLRTAAGEGLEFDLAREPDDGHRDIVL